MGNSDKKLRRKVRNSYIISTVSIALVIFMLGSVGYLILTALEATDKLRENVTVNVMLKDSVDDQQKDELKARLSENENVRGVVYVSKDEASAEFKEYSGEDFEKFIGFNPLPASFKVNFEVSHKQLEALAAFEKEVGQWDGVDELVYQRNVIEGVGTNINKFNMVILFFGATLLFIAVILLNNTIRITIFSKRYIISTMKLVGATNGFIVRPFLKTALLQGIYAALMASALFALMLWGLHEGLPEIRLALRNREILYVVGGMFVTGVLISLVFTIFAVNKFVKMPTDAVHYY